MPPQPDPGEPAATSLWPAEHTAVGSDSSLLRATGFDPLAPPKSPPPGQPRVSLGEATRFWFRLGWISFGGPAGQIALMHEELVERRRWIGERRFVHALNYCMLLPGPEAQQLATYLGWLMHRTWGGIVAGALFVLPSLLILTLLAAAYVSFGDVPWVAGLFYGIKPAVAALVVQAAWRLGARTLHNGTLWGLAAAAFVAVFALQVPFPVVVVAAALVGLVGSRLAPSRFGGAEAAPGASVAADPLAEEPPRLPTAVVDDALPPPPHARFSRRALARVVLTGFGLWALPMLVLAGLFGAQGTLTQMGWFFTQAALLTFGGAYAVLPFVYQGAVAEHGWVSAAQMMDALALGESTPGPLIMIVAFVAYIGGWRSPELAEALAVFGPHAPLVAGALAAVVVTWFTFLPSFVFILAGGPLVESTRGVTAFTAPLTAITAAVIGVIAQLALFLAAHVLWPKGWAGGTDIAAALIGLAAGYALIVRRTGVVQVLAACAAAGVVVHLGLPASLRLLG